MFLQRLELIDFRNYASLQLELTAPLTIFSGHNAQGKTNILEAVLLLAMARSPRTSRDGEMVRWQQTEAYVRGEVRRRERPAVSLAVALHRRGTKTFKVDGQVRRRIVDAIGEINVVMFGPEDLRLVGGGPGERRAYLNSCLGQISGDYLRALAGYRGVLRQRNKLLKTGRSRGVDPRLLDAYDDQLAAEAAVLIVERVERVRGLAEAAAAAHQRLAGGRELLEVTYQPNVPLPERLEPEAVSQAVMERLAARRDEELRRGVTVVGPHRDDLQVAIDGREARTYGSQGQQRTAALALKMAELQVVAGAIGEPPLLLLDDVMSELDDRRREAVMALVDETDQVLITCAQTRSFAPRVLDRAALYRVEAGTLEPLAAEADR